MRIASVSTNLSGKRPPMDMPTPRRADIGQRATPSEQEDDVLLHTPAEIDLNGRAGLNLLVALLQGILDGVRPGSLTLTDTLRTDTVLSGAHPLPAWYTPAQHAIVAQGADVLRLCAIGEIATGEAAPLPFVLDMQVLRSPFARLEESLDAAFLFTDGVGPLAGARISFSLSVVPPEPAFERDDLPRPARTPPTAPILSGSPLFAQFALGWQPDILCMAARLVPTEAATASPTHLPQGGDGSYLTMEEQSGISRHQVDVSA
jgi:hypothetical protein